MSKLDVMPINIICAINDNGEKRRRGEEERRRGEVRRGGEEQRRGAEEEWRRIFAKAHNLQKIYT